MASIDHDPRSTNVGDQDRRRDARFLASFPVALSTTFGGRQLCMCREMSAVGGLLLTAGEHKPGDVLQLELFTNVPGGAPHRAMARVARVQKRRDANVSWSYETAVEFASPTRKLTVAAKALSARQRLIPERR